VIAKELEGLVAKRKDSLYLPGVRTRDGVKMKPKGPMPAERFKYS
jgi:ATP-dependent DNA ligase